MKDEHKLNLALIAVFISGIVVGMILVTNELKLTNMILEATENKVTLLEYQLQILENEITILKKTIETYRHLLGEKTRPVFPRAPQE